MPLETQNYGFKKPTDNETADIAVINQNMDAIDSKIKTVENKADNALAAASSVNIPGASITVNQAVAPESPGNGTITQVFGWLANRLKTITGKSNWWDAPASTLEDAANHAAGTSVHSATSAATAGRIIIRDANGRAKIAAPSASDDIARKDTVDTVQSNLNTHITEKATTGSLGHVRVDNISVGVDANGIVSAKGLVGNSQIVSYSENCIFNTNASGIVTLNLSSANNFRLTLTGATTLGFTNLPASGWFFGFSVIITQGATAQAITYPASVKWQNDIIPDISVPNKTSVLVFITTDGGNRFYGFLAGRGLVT